MSREYYKEHDKFCERHRNDCGDCVYRFADECYSAFVQDLQDGNHNDIVTLNTIDRKLSAIIKHLNIEI